MTEASMKQMSTTRSPVESGTGAARVLIATLALALLIGLVPMLAACATEKQGAYATAPASIEPNGPISWGEAQSRIGDRLTAEGPVASVHEAGGEVVLNVGVDAPDPSRLVIVIPASARAKFPKDAAVTYQDELVRVTGMIEGRDGVATIVVTKPAELKTGL
jgi:hypothetical protein